MRPCVLIILVYADCGIGRLLPVLLYIMNCRVPLLWLKKCTAGGFLLQLYCTEPLFVIVYGALQKEIPPAYVAWRGGPVRKSHIGWRLRFFGIGFRDTYTFTNSCSVKYSKPCGSHSLPAPPFKSPFHPSLNSFLVQRSSAEIFQRKYIL